MSAKLLDPGRFYDSIPYYESYPSCKDSKAFANISCLWKRYPDAKSQRGTGCEG